MWQDIVIAIVQFVFSIALIPSIFSDKKPNIFSSVITFVGLIVMIICFFTLGLYNSVIWSSFSALGWLVLLLQEAKKEYKCYFESNNTYIKEGSPKDDIN